MTRAVLLSLLLVGCASRVVAAPEAGPCDPPVAIACTVDGDSPTWGPGPNMYCPVDDGTEWHISASGSTHYERQEGTAHSASRLLCELAPDGHVMLEATAKETR